MKRILFTLVAVFGVALASCVPVAPVDAAPAHNETGLSFFSCGATRPNPPGPTTGADLTVNHSHRIAANSSPGHYDWYDCEGYESPAINGCVWATYYIYDINPSTGQPYGIFGPFNVTCFGDWPT